MTVLRYELQVAAPVEAVFDALADLPGYARWLPRQGSYSGTHNISDTPVRLGTTYSDRLKTATMRGEVVEFDPPRALGFDQEVRQVYGGLAVEIRYRLQPRDGGTWLERTTTPRMSGVLAILAPMVVRSIRSENRRTLAMLKAYLEADGA